MSVASSLLPTETTDKYIQEWGKNKFKNQGSVLVSRFIVILKLCTNRHAHILILNHSSWSSKRGQNRFFEKATAACLTWLGGCKYIFNVYTASPTSNKGPVPVNVPTSHNFIMGTDSHVVS
jgi:hypothetical protein